METRNVKVYTFDEFKKEYEALYMEKYNKGFYYKVRSFFIRNFSLTYGIIKQIIELENEQDDKTVKDIRERINNKLKDLVKQNEVMEEKEGLRIGSSCSAGKSVEVPKKGYLYIDFEKAKEYYLKGGVHREIALNAGYEEAELNPIRLVDVDIFKTEKQAKSALAYAQLTQLMALPEYNGYWVPNWSDYYEKKYIIRRVRNGFDTDYYSNTHHHISFKSAKIRDKFLDNNLDLLKEYFEFD